MAAYSDTIVNDAQARTAITSVLLKATNTVEADASGADLHFQFDDVQTDATGDDVVAGERRDLTTLLVAAAEAAGSVPKQVRHQTAEVLEPSATGADSLPIARLALKKTVQEDATGAEVVVSQRLAAASGVLEAVAQAAASAVSAVLSASVTLQEDAAGEAGEPPVFWEDAKGEAVAVSQKLHAKFTAVADATGQASIISEALASLFKDTVVADATGASSVQAQTLKATQTIVNEGEAVEELLNVLSDEAWVFNAWTLAFSRYTSFGVNDAAAVDGDPLFTLPTGVHAFSATTFADALARFGLNNFQSMAPKRLRAVYVSTIGKGVVKMSTFHGSGGSLVERRYQTPERDSAVPINRRISPARGNTGQYWGLQVETAGGNRQTVTRIHVIPLVTGRNF